MDNNNNNKRLKIDTSMIIHKDSKDVGDKKETTIEANTDGEDSVTTIIFDTVEEEGEVPNDALEMNKKIPLNDHERWAGKPGMINDPYSKEKKHTIPILFPLSRDIDYSTFRVKDNSTKLHLTVLDNTTRGMIFGKIKYDKHHSDPKFVEEYNKHLNGMMHMWRYVNVYLFNGLRGSKMKVAQQNQYDWARNHVPCIQSHVNAYTSQPLGKLSFHYIQATVPGIDNEEDVTFVHHMANCVNFEVVSKTPNGVWKVVTKFHMLNQDGTMKIVKFAFGYKM